MSLMVGAKLAGDPIAVLPVLYHLLRRRDLVADLTEPLHAGTLVHVGRNLMGAGRPSVLQIGDWVHVEDADHQVVALTGTAVRLRSATGAASVMLASYLLACPDFALVEGTPMPTVEPFGLLDSLPPEVVDRARGWQRHLVEVVTRLPLGVGPGTAPRPGFDPPGRPGHCSPGLPQIRT
jgi:hypothetical protein